MVAPEVVLFVVDVLTPMPVLIPHPRTFFPFCVMHIAVVVMVFIMALVGGSAETGHSHSQCKEQ